VTRLEFNLWSAALIAGVLLWLALIILGWPVAVLVVVAFFALCGSVIFEWLRAQ
jgi:hypothetical protein